MGSNIIIRNYGENTCFVTAHAEISCEGSRFSAHDILENVVSAMDSELKIYDFRLPEMVDGEVKKISFRLLVPHRHVMSDKEIREKLRRKVETFQPGSELEITFLRSFV